MLNRSVRATTLIAIGAICLLAACAKPTAMTPNVSNAEITAERNRQLKLAKDAERTDYSEVSYNKTDLEGMHQRLQVIVNKLAPEATKMCRELNGPEADCNFLVELSPKGKGVNAHADGTKVVVYPAMVDFTKSDTQLAFVLAHEYTHHMMGHVDSAKTNTLGGVLLGSLADVIAATQGVSTQGQFGKLGVQVGRLTYSPAFEHEADYIGLYILARAGYNIKDAPNFWRAMSTNNPQGIYNRTTHPTTPERFVMMEKTIQEIEAKKQRNMRLLPNLQPEN